MADRILSTPNAARLADGPRVRAVFGAAVVAASVLYFATDVLEAAQGGFSSTQLWLTLLAEAAIPVVVIGLALAQSPAFSRLGWTSAWIYAYSYVFFTATVIYAIAEDTPDYAALSDELGLWMLLHGALMVIGGLGFGAAVLAAGFGTERTHRRGQHPLGCRSRLSESPPTAANYPG